MTLYLTTIAPPCDNCDSISIIIICGATMIGTLLMIICITATVIIAPCRKKKKSGKKQSIHDGVISVQLTDDRPQQCTHNTSEQSKNIKLKLHYISANPNSFHNGKKPAQTGKKSVQTDSDYDDVVNPTDNVIEMILTDPNHCHRMGKMLK